MLIKLRIGKADVEMTFGVLLILVGGAGMIITSILRWIL
jgi:hypothetical protein